MTGIIAIVFLSEVFNTIGQVFFKKSTEILNLPERLSPGALARFFGRVFATGWIWLGLGVMGLGLVVWFFAISREDLSLVYPMGSMQYILVLLSARIFLKEKINRLKIIGTLFVIAGILLIARS